MAKRKTPAKKRAASRPAAKRRTYHKKSSNTYIPSAAATVGLAYAMKTPILTAVNSMSVQGVKSAARQAVQVDTLKKAAIYTAGAYVAGEAIKRYAPKIIKTPAGKIAKKIPRLF